MKPAIGVVSSTSDGVSAAAPAFVVSRRTDLRFSSTPLLCMQQPSSHRVEVGQCRSDFQAVQVLGKAAVTDLLEAKHPLDHPDGVLHLSPDARFGSGSSPSRPR